MERVYAKPETEGDGAPNVDLAAPRPISIFPR
jgi:hypothetical protein